MISPSHHGRSRRSALVAGLLALSLLPILQSCSGGAEDARDQGNRPPDVFLLVIDTLRRDHLSAYGYPRPTSPNLDALAADGVLLEDVTAQCSWTKPSVVSMMTGRYITTYRDTFEDSATTMAEAFRDAGYRTVGVVSNVLLSEKAGFDRGFEFYDARRREGKEKGLGGPCRTIDTLLAALWDSVDEAIQSEEGEDRPPLFVWFHVMEPHSPYLPREQYGEVLPLTDIPEADPVRWSEADFESAGQEAPEDDPGWANTWRRIRRWRNRYDHEIRYADEHLAELLAGLRDRGLLEQAVIAVAADHGEALWEYRALSGGDDGKPIPPDKYYHQEHGVFLYEGLTGTPMILWGAGLPEGARIPDAVENVDLFPTLMELADIAPPEGLHGQSMLGLIETGTWSKETVHSYVLQHSSIRECDSGLKLIIPTEAGVAQGARPRLFHLPDDPLEHRDLIDQRPGDADRLSALIHQWISRYPMVSTIAKLQDKQTLEDLKALGYGGE